ncbi:MAG: YjzC family protein [Dehalococcoidales bacterium]|nr:YjzC family protein [Dehalococcoidales bacterium]
MASRFTPTSRLKRYDVVNANGEDLGQVQTFIVDMVTGRITLVVVAFGGILGLTDKWVAIPFERLVWRPKDNKFLLNVPRQALEEAPGINKDTWPKRVTAKWLASVYAKYGCSPYWKSRMGETFNSGEKVKKSGVYEYVAHIGAKSCQVDCQPTDAERELPLSTGETFPPLRSCGKAAVWRLIRAA